MTDPADLVRPDAGQSAHLIHVIDPKGYEAWLADQPDRHRSALVAQGFKPTGYSYAILPGEKADDWSVVTCVANVASFSSWCLAKLAEVLPEGHYRLAAGEPGPAILGWMTAQYRFERYKQKKSTKGPRVLLTPQPGAIDAAAAQARATTMVRDMVNVPTADMGPDQIEGQAQTIAARFGATMSVTRGDALISGYPMIHAVGRAADRANQPRLIELLWGRDGAPRIAIVGKGITFDTGGS